MVMRVFYYSFFGPSTTFLPEIVFRSLKPGAVSDRQSVLFCRVFFFFFIFLVVFLIFEEYFKENGNILQNNGFC